MSSNTVISCVAACEVTIKHEISLPPFDLDLDGGLQIGSAILLVWGVGYAFRVLIRSLNFDGVKNDGD